MTNKRTAVSLVLALGLVIGVGVSTVNRAAISPVQRTDFTVYQLAGKAVIDGTDIYQVRNVRGWAYVYPPPFAILMAPFALLSVFWGALVWYLISVALIVWALVMCVRTVRSVFPVEDRVLILSIVPIILLLVWLMSGLARGQASVLLMWLVLAAFCWHWEGHDLRGGACLAGAILLKAFPLVLLAYFVWRWKWKFLLATLATLVVVGLILPGAVFGFKRSIAYWESWEQIIARPALATENQRAQSGLNEQLLDPQKPRNQSLSAVLSRLTNDNSLARGATVVVGLAMLAAMWAVGRKAGKESELLIGSAVVTWILLLPPISETHYFVLLLLPLMALVAVAMKEPEDTTRRITGWTLIVFGAVVLASACVRQLEVVGAPCWATLMVWSALVLVVVRRERRQDIQQPG
ncbi:MAG TPA: glycosyltransferase family 87 protein [Candidatus Saccharimonadales bacterium]|nr:glycosyltransferase family 87 protein [Candidatus Saccharimonadales bacterium]